MSRELKNIVGEKYITKEGYEIEIIDYLDNKNCTIKFKDTSIYYNINYSSIKKGSIKNPFHKSVKGIGYLGLGKFKPTSNKESTKVYSTWNSMLKRCYDIKYHEKYPTYIGCSVDERWHNFQVFAEWFENNYVEGFVLDKDILLKGNKVYSPKTCCFVPQEINKLVIKCNKRRGYLPIGVSKKGNRFRSRCNVKGDIKNLGIFKTPDKAFKAYKKAKEKEIKDTARVCKTLLKKEAYEALVNYKIEITD